MYAVIFRARIRRHDKTYETTAAQLREVACKKYGCLDYISMSEGNDELTISYWASKQDIQAWKHDPEHRAAQTLGQTRWYASYQIQIIDVEREYHG